MRGMNAKEEAMNGQNERVLIQHGRVAQHTQTHMSQEWVVGWFVE